MNTRRVPRARAYAPDPDAPGRLCDQPGCEELGCYRAPKSRTALNDYYWFCLGHVRAYNANWDYYKNMTPGQIEQELRADISWQRPSWRFGTHGTGSPLHEDLLRDPMLNMDRRPGAQAHRSQAEAPPELRQPLDVLGLTWPVTMDTVKARYKALAKAHHPDINGGRAAAEERIKAINVAYTVLKTHWPAEEPEAARG
ncbi:J domain-containing protein [Acidisoma sp. C75]